MRKENQNYLILGQSNRIMNTRGLTADEINQGIQLLTEQANRPCQIPKRYERPSWKDEFDFAIPLINDFINKQFKKFNIQGEFCLSESRIKLVTGNFYRKEICKTSDGSYFPQENMIYINIHEEKVNYVLEYGGPLFILPIVVHEALHMASYHSFCMKYELDNEEFIIFNKRMGVCSQNWLGTEDYFNNLDEAVTEKLTDEFMRLSSTQIFNQFV